MIQADTGPTADSANAKLAVGIIGVGAMGGAMARCLLRNGYRVIVRDIIAERVDALLKLGAVPVASAAAVAQHATIMLSVVVDSTQTDEVLFGADGFATAAGRNSTVVLCSTMAPDYVAGLPTRLAPRGIKVVDAPISGGPMRALAGTLSMMAAATPEAMERVVPVLEVLATKLFRVGARAGDGSRMKIVNNMLAGINLAAGAEAMALAERMGMDLQLVHDVVCASSGGSWIFADRMPRAIAADYAPRAAAKILTKDVGLAIAAAEAAGVPVALARAAHRAYEGTVAQGLGEADDAALIEYFRALIRRTPQTEPNREQ